MRSQPRAGDALPCRLHTRLDDVLDGHDPRGLTRVDDLERRARDQRVPAHEVQDLVPVDVQHLVPPAGLRAEADVPHRIGGQPSTGPGTPTPTTSSG